MHGDRGLMDKEISAVLPVRRLSVMSLDALALGAVFLQVTEAYRPLGYIAGFTTSLQANLAFLGFFVFYLVARNKTLNELHSWVVAGWVLALVVAPCMIMSLQLFDNSVTIDRLTYWTVFSILFALLFLVAAVLWTRWGPALSTPFFLCCIGATWVGFIVNWLDYDFLRKVMAFGSIPIRLSTVTDRMIGFYPHPNQAAFSLVLYFAALACVRKFLTASIFLQALALFGCLAGVIVTGSRTSLLLFFIVFAWYLLNLFRLNRADFAGVPRRSPVALLIPLMVVSATLVTLQLVANSQNEISGMLSSRMNSFVDLLGGKVGDESANLRVSVLSDYYSDLLKAPLLGQGPDFATDQITVGNYANVSQNSWVEWAVAFGVPYALLMAFMLIVSYRFAVRVVPNTMPLLLSHARLILIILAAITFSMVMPFWIRSAVGVLGALLGILLHAKANMTAASLPDSGIGRRRTGWAEDRIRRSAM